MRKGLFITGTDTEVGKTWVGSQLAQNLYDSGLALSVRKPAESGCREENGQLIPADAQQYWQALNGSQSLESICPFRLKAALAPVQAARLEGIRLTNADLIKACTNQENSFLLVEGAGGFYSPMSEDGLNSDLAKALSLPVLLVASDKLGCLNHILLTQRAIELEGLSLAAVVMNQISEPSDPLLSNADMLREHLSVPVLETTEADWLSQLSSIVYT